MVQTLQIKDLFVQSSNIVLLCTGGDGEIHPLVLDCEQYLHILETHGLEKKSQLLNKKVIIVDEPKQFYILEE